MIQFNSKEVMSAAGDALALQMGAAPATPHPLASQLGLRQIAYAAGDIMRKRQAFENDLSVMGRGMGTTDFSKALAQGVSAVAVAAYGAQAEHNNFVAQLGVNNFKPVELPAMGGDLDLEILAENAEIRQGFALLEAGAQQVSLTTYAKILAVSRQAIINDSFNAIRQIFQGLGTSAARLEGRLVAAALESDKLMDDGAAVFHADYANIVTGDLSGATLGQAVALLRTQKTTAGQRADLAAKHLVLSPDMEYLARTLLRDAALDLKISVLANLPNNRFYVLADQATCPTVATLRLADSRTPVRVEQNRLPANVDGTAVRVVADLGACMLRRVGIVRGGSGV